MDKMNFLVLIDGTTDGQSCATEQEAHNIAKTKCARENRPVVVFRVVGVYKPGEPVFTSHDAPAQPQPDAPAFRVGDIVEVKIFRREWWFSGFVRKIGRSGNPWVEYVDNGKTETAWFDIADVRRPAAPEPERFKFEFGDKVNVTGKNIAGADYSPCTGVIVRIMPKENQVDVWIDAERDWYTFDASSIERI